MDYSTDCYYLGKDDKYIEEVEICSIIYKRNMKYNLHVITGLVADTHTAVII